MGGLKTTRLGGVSILANVTGQNWHTKDEQYVTVALKNIDIMEEENLFACSCWLS